MNTKIDIPYAESLIKDFPHDHGFYGCNVIKKVKDFIKLKYNMEFSTNNYNYILFNGIDRIKVYYKYSDYHTYRMCVYKNIMIIIHNNYYYNDDGIYINPSHYIKIIKDTEIIDDIPKEFIDAMDATNISKVLMYECIDDRVPTIIAICHILNKISGYSMKNSITILKKLSSDKIYTRKEMMNLGVSEMSININKQNIPIIEEISEDQYIFYSNNFIKYQSILENEQC